MTETNFPNIHPIISETPFRPLTEEEIDKLFKELDTDGDGSVSYNELEAKLVERDIERAGGSKKVCVFFCGSPVIWEGFE
jgi:Ca2+-binding EF-hand superfamily protein